MMAYAKIITDTWGMDGAYGNEKLHAHRAAVNAKTDIATAMVLCCSHKTGAIENTGRDLAGEEVTKSLFSLLVF